jgi:hypothetical protein
MMGKHHCLMLLLAILTRAVFFALKAPPSCPVSNSKWHRTNEIVYIFNSMIADLQRSLPSSFAPQA